MGSSQFVLLNRQIQALTREITIRRRTEEELKRKTSEAEEANRIKSQFLSNVSHELRTPLNAILGYTSLLLDQVYGPVGEDMREPLERAKRNADDLLRLVNDVLDFSKIESGKMPLDLVPVDISSLIHDVYVGMKLFIDKKSLRVQWNLEKALPMIECDANKIRQVFVNLFPMRSSLRMRGDDFDKESAGKGGLKFQSRIPASASARKSFLKYSTCSIRSIPPRHASSEASDWAWQSSKRSSIC